MQCVHIWGVLDCEEGELRRDVAPLGERQSPVAEIEGTHHLGETLEESMLRSVGEWSSGDTLKEEEGGGEALMIPRIRQNQMEAK